MTLPAVTLSEQAGIRYLHLDSIWVQGAMRIRAPDFVELEYVRRMLASLLWGDLDGWRGALAVQLGLGAGAITRFLHRQVGMRTTAVELNPSVVDACVLAFDLRDAPGLEVVLADAGEWLGQACAPGSVHQLHVDLYDHDAAAPVLDHEDFYADCRRALDAAGVMSVNLFGRCSSFAGSAARVAAVFGERAVWHLAATGEGNTTLIATRDAGLPAAALLRERCDAIEERFGHLGLRARKWPRWIRRWRDEESR